MTAPLFSFGIITDTHVRVPGGDLSSPFPVNEKANARARYATALLAAHRPALSIHLGDVVHPLPHMSAFGPAAAEAKAILAPLGPDLRHVPGNHDIGDKPSPGMPAKSSTAEGLAQYRETFGPPWQSWQHQGIRFVAMTASLVNSGLAAESDQRAWLEETLRAAEGERVFLFTHYPPFIAAPDEADHYDNYAEPGRHWLLDLAADTGVEAVFSGHVHHFFMNRYRGVRLYCLLPTSFTRQDYAEMFPVAPAPEYGRDDAGKYAVTLVDVMAEGHRLRVVPTDGLGMEPGDPSPEPTPEPAPLPLIPHLRHAWFEARRLPYKGPMEEFSRKLARNDYPLLRLLQLGITTVRIPLSDLEDPEARSRIEDWAACGQRFVFFRIGLPKEVDVEALRGIGDAAAALEVLATRADLADLGPGLPKAIAYLPVPFWLSKVTTSADGGPLDAPYSHAVSAGFLTAQADLIFASLPGGPPPGLVFQLPWGTDPAVTIPDLAARCLASGTRLVANVRLSPANPAAANFDDRAIAAHLRKAIDAAEAAGSVTLQCDTFEDVDRGYAPRNGLIDRRGNVRLRP
ncbi:MAG: metallophosphoesterase [Pseudomonadota bacterium]